MTCRGPEIAITSPAWSTRPGSASSDTVPPANPVDEQPVLGCACLGGRNGRSNQRGSLGQSVGAQLELSPGRGQAPFATTHSQSFFEL